ncbi:SET domain-containing protein [Phlebopus sp. FC_14]|nr:SET domain-containing protein [Phlebopus sp. FC_14]
MASDHLEIRNTAYGGRSLFAKCDISPGTLIHSSPAPFAHVIYKDYRREVCAECFAYSASDLVSASANASRTWSEKWSRDGAAAAWFCSEACKQVWEQEDASSLLMEIDAILTKGQTASRKKAKPAKEDTKLKILLTSFRFEEGRTTQEAVDQAWGSAQTLVASKAQLSSFCSTLDLEDMELEIARSLACAIVQRYVCDGRHLREPSFQSIPRRPLWSELLDLQTNEVFNVQMRPYILSAHLRIYAFLCNVLPNYLRPYVSTVRDVLARDTGNAFGIWDGGKRDEMLGWGIWVSASYFNHSCAPNVRKTRVGRALHFETTRAIAAGEELCISYIDTDSPVQRRRRELEESWFFTCRCRRCEEESLPTSTM